MGGGRVEWFENTRTQKQKSCLASVVGDLEVLCHSVSGTMSSLEFFAC